MKYADVKERQFLEYGRGLKRSILFVYKANAPIKSKAILIQVSHYAHLCKQVTMSGVVHDVELQAIDFRSKNIKVCKQVPYMEQKLKHIVLNEI